MIRFGAIILGCLILGACASPGTKEEPGAPLMRQQPTDSTPGVSMSGSVSVGVVRSF